MDAMLERKMCDTWQCRGMTDVRIMRMLSTKDVREGLAALMACPGNPRIGRGVAGTSLGSILKASELGSFVLHMCN